MVQQHIVRQPADTHSRVRWDIWGQWTAANLAGEAIGLGATLLLGILLFSQWEARLGPVMTAVLGILLGACVEGAVVGTAQWVVLRRPLADVTWSSWAEATAIGAGIAWALGMIPFTFMSSSAGAPGAAGASPPQIEGLALYGLAALLGLVAGAILAVAQWRVLRRYVPTASVWIPANACAWALGMALVFVGTSSIPDTGITLGSAATLILFIVLAGATVGATHGLALIWLLRERDRRQQA